MTGAPALVMVPHYLWNLLGGRESGALGRCRGQGQVRPEENLLGLGFSSLSGGRGHLGPRWRSAHCFTHVALSDPGTMKLVYILGQSPHDWKTTIQKVKFQPFSINKIYVRMLG